MEDNNKVVINFDLSYKIICDEDDAADIRKIIYNAIGEFVETLNYKHPDAITNITTTAKEEK